MSIIFPATWGIAAPPPPSRPGEVVRWSDSLFSLFFLP